MHWDGWNETFNSAEKNQRNCIQKVHEVRFQRASFILFIPFAPSQGTQNVCDHFLFPSPDKARNNRRGEPEFIYICARSLTIKGSLDWFKNGMKGDKSNKKPNPSVIFQVHPQHHSFACHSLLISAIELNHLHSYTNSSLLARIRPCASVLLPPRH